MEKKIKQNKFLIYVFLVISVLILMLGIFYFVKNKAQNDDINLSLLTCEELGVLHKKESEKVAYTCDTYNGCRGENIGLCGDCITDSESNTTLSNWIIKIQDERLRRDCVEQLYCAQTLHECKCVNGSCAFVTVVE